MSNYCKMSSISIGGTYVNTVPVSSGGYSDNVSLAVAGKAYVSSDVQVDGKVTGNGGFEQSADNKLTSAGLRTSKVIFSDATDPTSNQLGVSTWYGAGLTTQAIPSVATYSNLASTTVPAGQYLLYGRVNYQMSTNPTGVMLSLAVTTSSASLTGRGLDQTREYIWVSSEQGTVEGYIHTRRKVTFLVDTEVYLIPFVVSGSSYAGNWKRNNSGISYTRIG